MSTSSEILTWKSGSRRFALSALVVLLLSTGTSTAQTPSQTPAQTQAQTPTQPAGRWEFRVTSGGFVPTGAQRSFLEDAQVSAAQVSWLARPSLAVTGTFGWARSRDLMSVDSPKLDVFMLDLGAEARSARWNAGRLISFSPFAGLGVGSRSYNFRNLEVDATHNVAGYGAVGGELGIGRVGVRLEVRDYATGFKPLVGVGESDTRNDVVFMVGLRFNVQRASRGQE